MARPKRQGSGRWALPEKLSDGDLIRADGDVLRVVGEPLLSHRGWSLFDDFEMFFQVRVRTVGADRDRTLRLVPGVAVELLDREEP